MSRYVGKCKACNCYTSGVSTGQECNRYKADPKRTGDVYTHERTGGHVIDCRKCGAPQWAKPVRGKFSAKHVCSAKCMSSHGTICECSCAGKNHGSAHAA